MTGILEHAGVRRPSLHVEGGRPRRGPRGGIDERDLIVDGVLTCAGEPLDESQPR
jgi:hypothetical protein